MNILENLKITFHQGTTLIKLIYINTAAFVVLNLILIGYQLFNHSGDFLISYLAMPALPSELLCKAWTPFTYMFLHEGVFHLLFNMLSLFWFGKIFLMYYSEKQLVGLYIIGGLLGGLFYVVAFNLFPYYANNLNKSILLGASASIMAIIMAAAIKFPNMELKMVLIGNVKLKYIAFFFIFMSFFGITSDNGGGQLAHLGGTLAGYLFVVSLRNGIDLTSLITRVIDFFSTAFGRKKLRVKTNPNRKSTRMSDGEYNSNKVRKIAEIDKILDKIKTSGYDSLSAEEKNRLFQQGNNN